MGRGFIPFVERGFPFGAYFVCGYCDCEIGEDEDYCSCCGEKINWEGIEYE